jgi:hypothetical protein
MARRLFLTCTIGSNLAYVELSLVACFEVSFRIRVTSFLQHSQSQRFFLRCHQHLDMLVLVIYQLLESVLNNII